MMPWLVVVFGLLLIGFLSGCRQPVIPTGQAVSGSPVVVQSSGQDPLHDAFIQKMNAIPPSPKISLEQWAAVHECVYAKLLAKGDTASMQAFVDSKPQGNSMGGMMGLSAVMLTTGECVQETVGR
jgi:hypothetical protein